MIHQNANPIIGLHDLTSVPASVVLHCTSSLKTRQSMKDVPPPPASVTPAQTELPSFASGPRPTAMAERANPEASKTGIIAILVQSYA